MTNNNPIKLFVLVWLSIAKNHKKENKYHLNYIQLIIYS